MAGDIAAALVLAKLDGSQPQPGLLQLVAGPLLLLIDGAELVAQADGALGLEPAAEPPLALQLLAELVLAGAGGLGALVCGLAGGQRRRLQFEQGGGGAGRWWHR